MVASVGPYALKTRLLEHHGETTSDRQASPATTMFFKAGKSTKGMVAKADGESVT